MTEFKVSSLIRQYRGLILLSALTSVMFSSLALTMPMMLKVVIDRVLPSRDWALFFLLAAVMIAIYILRFTMRIITGNLGTYTVTRILLDVRQRIFKHLQNLSLRFYEEYRTGKLISNVISDVALLQGLISLCISMVDQFFTMAFITFAVFFINWKLALIAMCALPIHFINFFIFNKIIRKNALLMQEKMSEISANLAETINGIRVVKSFSKGRAESLHFFKNMRPTLELAIKMNQEGNVCHGIYEMLTLFTYLIVICGGIFAVGNDFSIGDFVAFYTYIGLQVGPIAVLAAQMNVLSQGLAGAQRIMKLLKVIPDITDAPDAVDAGRLTGRISFDHVSFKYADTPVLRDFSLRIEPGEKVALVGPSGCGKSTISNLLLRFYDVLFSGTIRDNLAYARPNASMEEIRKAAELANVAEFVEKLDKKYDTVIGENGASLSGGQKQRIAIARAVLKNPGILLLDEATSALDTVSEKLVQQSLDTLMEGRTTIIIAHRLSTIRNADKIVVLKSGQIEQLGTHDELMAQDGTYRELYTTQQKAAAEDSMNDHDNIFYQQHPKALEMERISKQRWK